MATANDVHSSRGGNNATVELATDEEGNVISGGGSGVKFKVGGATTGRPLPPLEVSNKFSG